MGKNDRITRNIDQRVQTGVTDAVQTATQWGGERMRPKRKVLEVIFSAGRPTAVILDINEYQEMLERLEDAEDLKALKAMRKKVLTFRRLGEFLKDYAPSV